MADIVYCDYGQHYAPAAAIHYYDDPGGRDQFSYTSCSACDSAKAYEAERMDRHDEAERAVKTFNPPARIHH